MTFANKKNNSLFVLILSLFTVFITAQNNRVNNSNKLPPEVQDDLYIPVLRSSMQKSKAYTSPLDL